MIPRIDLLAGIEGDLATNAAVVLLGPRQAGKTTLARQIAGGRPSVYLDLEDPTDRAIISAARDYLNRQRGKLVVLDEVQRAPEIFAALRGVIDDRRAAGERYGQFLLLGSAGRDLLKQTSESLAGRVAYRELTPLRPDEATGIDRDVLWSRGGFPDSLLAPNDNLSYRWRNDFVSTYLERDLPQLGIRTPSETTRRLLTMLAHDQGAELNASKLAASLGLSGKTVSHHVDTFVDLLLLRRLMPWSANVKKRLVKSPKTYMRDSGIVHALLGLRSVDALLGHPVVGMSWEGFVIEAIVGGTSHRAWFYRTLAGAEIDLLIERDDGALWAFEVKRSESASPRRGFFTACEDLEVARRYLVHSGERAFPLPHGVEALPLMDAIAVCR